MSLRRSYDDLLAGVETHPELAQPPTEHTQIASDRTNPFFWQRRLSVRERIYRYIKYGLGAIVFPIRLVFLTGIITTGWFCAKMTTALGLEDNKPLTPLQRFFMAPVPFLARSYLFVLGFYWTKGTPAKPHEAALVVANHISFIEVIYLFSKFVPASVSRKENEGIPFVGPLMKATRAIPVDRLSPTSRTDTMQKIKQTADNAFTKDGFPQVMIFPEGCTTNGQAIISFKYGAFAPGLPVQPVAIRYPNRHFDPSWTANGPQLLGILYQLSCQFINYMDVTFLPVYVPNEAEKADPGLFAENVRKAIASELKIPTTEHSYEDALLVVHAHKARVPINKYNVEMKSIKQLLRVGFDDAKEMLRKFGSVNKRHDGELTIEDFAKFMELPADSEVVQELFKLFDVNDSGRVGPEPTLRQTFRSDLTASIADIKELVLGLAMVNDTIKHDAGSITRKAFSVFDSDGDGRISQEEVSRILRTVMPSITEEETRRLFDESDKDHNGFLSYEEFEKFFSKHPVFVSVAGRLLEKYGHLPEGPLSPAESKKTV